MLYIPSLFFGITYLDHSAALLGQKLYIHFLHEDWRQLLDLTNTLQHLCFFKGRKKKNQKNTQGIAHVKKKKPAKNPKPKNSPKT